MTSTGERLLKAMQEAHDVVQGLEPAGAIYVNGHRYVPVSELDRLRSALEWYGEQAEAMARYTIVINPKAMEAIVVTMSLDAGKRARAALGQEPTE